MKIQKKNLFFTFIFSLMTSTMSLFGMYRDGAAGAGPASAAQSKGIVVVVAGPSSCGKTMVTARLTEALNEVGLHGGNWIRFSLDDVTAELDAQSSSDDSDKGSQSGSDSDNADADESDSDDEEFEPISDLSDGNNVLCQRVCAAVKSGSNVVIDTVFDEDEDKLDAFKVELSKKGIEQPKRCLTVFLYCSVETLLERVAVRNAKKDDDDTRNAGMVLRVFAKMMQCPKASGAAGAVAAADEAALRMSPKDLEHVVRKSPVIKKNDLDLDRLIWQLKYNLGLNGDDHLPALLVPKANYDCLVRSDTHPNDQWEKNVETAIDQIVGRLQRMMIRK